MSPESVLLSFFSLLLLLAVTVAGGRDPCDPTTLPDPRSLRSDQLTVLINGYAESRIPLLRSIAAAYSASPSVASIVVLWGNPSTPSQTLAQLSRNLSATASAAPISVLRQRSDSLNSRFFPRPSIATRAVLICDDDVEIDAKSVDFAFRVWNSNRNRLVGFFARSHDFDLASRSWIYTVHPDKYSIVLTKFMITRTESLYQYSCGGGRPMAEARAKVDQMRNCEDILMNFVAAEEASAGPILVAAERARDWGDPRNEGRREGVREAGLSSRRSYHRKRRGDCIREFHRILGKMPLRYSYGKVVDSVGEQGLCWKAGKLVLCDRQLPA
ncbi:glycosyltransferase family protein 64 C3 [Diospyros lotus]|uniref:glycosyltransferase family protein 64 C3 n=1 Tax=Diospyros lotus TaxID=55363 RepID=UPI00225AD94A|nr:glycosyltransferase family protein 64 C3 [Diospyros lotus]